MRTSSKGVARASLVVLACLAIVVCGPAGQRRYPLGGVVQEIKAGTTEVVVAHEDIPGFMPAMTMPFRVKRDGGLPNVRPGDRITATLVVTDKESWLEDVTVAVRGLPVAKATTGIQPAGAAPNDVVPDLGLVNQDGASIHLGQYQGRALAITFIYTRCPLPEFCPLLMKNFQKIDEALAREPVLFAKTHLLSISFDTAYDTPEVLRSFGRAFVEDRGQGRFSHWELATGSPEQVKAVADFFGMAYWGERGGITHSLRTAIIGPDGHVVRVYADNDWTVEGAVEEIRRATP